MIYLNRYKNDANPSYQKIYELFKDKNYFVITTNVEHQFQLAGFDKKDYFICKVIMAYFNVVFLAIIRLTIIKKLFLNDKQY